MSGNGGTGGNSGLNGSLAIVNGISQNYGRAATGGGPAGYNYYEVSYGGIGGAGGAGGAGAAGNRGAGSSGAIGGWGGSGDAGWSPGTIESAYLKYTSGAPTTPDHALWKNNRLVVETPAKLTYICGEIFDMSSLNASLQTSSSNIPIANDNLTVFYDFSGLGNTLVTVVYTAGSTQYVRHIPVTVIPAEMISGSLTLPQKITYVVGDALDLSGLALEVSYSGGGLEIITADQLTVDYPEDITQTVGIKTVTVSYPSLSYTKTFVVNVIAVAVDSIEVVSQPYKREYFVTEALNPAGMTIRAHYNNGSSDIIPYNVNTMSFYPEVFAYASDSFPCYVEYAGHSAPIPEIKVFEDPFLSYEVLRLPFKTAYFEGEFFDPNGLIVEIEYASGRLERVPMNALTFTPGDRAFDVVDTRVRARYTYGFGVNDFIQFDIPVTVSAITQIGIFAETQPNKTAYLEGQTFDPTGMTVFKLFNNGDTEQIPSTHYSLSHGVLSADDYFVIVTSGAYSTMVPVYVSAKIYAETPQIDGQPQNANLVEGNYCILYADANVFDGGMLTYQWYTNTTASNTGGTAIEGAADYSYSVPTDETGVFYYYAVITNTIPDNGDGGVKQTSATSLVATVAVIAKVHAEVPVIGTQPLDASVVEGETHTLSVAATTGDEGMLTYQWFKIAIDDISTISEVEDGENLYVEIDGATSSTYAPPTDVVGTFYYYVIVTNTINDNGDGGIKVISDVSDLAVLTVEAAINAQAPVITGNPQSGVATGGGTHMLTVVADAPTDGGTLSYQWYNNTVASNVGGTAIAGATGSSYVVPVNTSGYLYYYVAVTSTNSQVNGAKSVTTVSDVAVLEVDVPDDIAKIVVSGGNGFQGGYVDVTVSLENNPGIINMQLALNYDSNKLKLIGLTNGGVLTDFLPGGNINAVPYNLTWNMILAPGVNNAGNGAIVTLRFEVLTDAGVGDTEIIITYSANGIRNAIGGTVSFFLENGTVSIRDKNPGDVNNDGEITQWDVTLLRWYLAGGYEEYLPEDFNLLNADVDGDGEITQWDITLLRWYLAGGYGVELSDCGTMLVLK